MNRFSLKHALLAGIVGTAVMTMVMTVAPLMGLPKMNIPAMLSGFMHAPIFAGWMFHFMIGAALAGGFALMFAVRGNLPGWIKGALFGLIPWLMAQLIVMPMMGAPLFGGSIMIAMGSLIGHMMYGATIGIVYRPKTCTAEKDCHESISVRSGSVVR